MTLYTTVESVIIYLLFLYDLKVFHGNRERYLNKNLLLDRYKLDNEIEQLSRP